MPSINSGSSKYQEFINQVNKNKVESINNTNTIINGKDNTKSKTNL